MKIKMKEFSDSLRHMSAAAYGYLKFCVILAILPAFAALCIVYYIQDTGGASYLLYKMLNDLISVPAAVLLIAAVLSVCLEEKARK